jgi:DNA-binding XRE family transcriptional regulator
MNNISKQNNILNVSNRADSGEEFTTPTHSPEKAFFSNESVKKQKNLALRTRLQTLIKQKGWTNQEFYKISGVSRQYYYFISWGLWPCPLDIKLKIARVLEVDSRIIWRDEE